MAAIVSTAVGGGEIPPARTPFKIQDPYTGRFVWNKDDDLQLEGNGDGKELLWELEYATTVTSGAVAAETGYILKSVLTGKVMVDESAGDGRPSRDFGVKDFSKGGVLESQIWTMRPLECDTAARGRRGVGRLYSIQNRRNRAYIVNGLKARGHKQLLRTRVTNEESSSQGWRFILDSEAPTVLRSPWEFPEDFERSPTRSSSPVRILRRKRSRSGDYIDSYRYILGSSSSTEQTGEQGVFHENDVYWKRVPPIPDHSDEHLVNSTTAGGTNFLNEEVSWSWISHPDWKTCISPVSDFDISWIIPKIGNCTRTALKEKGTLWADGNHLLREIPWDMLPKLKESP